jgi:multiple sugar transport system permease protein
MQNTKKKHTIQYDNWGYAFIAPFFVIYIIFSLIPLLSTFRYSLYEYYRVGLNTIGPNFIGLENFKNVFSANDSLGKYFLNTLIMWVMGFVPQIIVSLMLAVWFTNTELNLKAQGFFKTVIYLPNLIMAATFAMLFFNLFSPNGPVNGILRGIAANSGVDPKDFEPIRFFTSTAWTRALVATMNFLMWYGNTTILLMAGVMGIDNSLFEAARIDGATPSQVFFKITMPLLLPIFVYVFITSLIGGIQMFDVPQILTNGAGGPNRTTMTIIMKLNAHLQSKNYGPAGAISVLLFVVTGVLSGIVYKSTMSKYQNKR